MSLAFFGSLSPSGVGFFPIAVTFPFPPCSRGLHPSSVSSLVAFRGCGLWSLRCICICGCFVSAVRLLSSVRRSLFLSWPFFLCATPSSASSVLVGPFPWFRDSFGSKVSLSDRVARWDESFIFLLPFCLLLWLIC